MSDRPADPSADWRRQRRRRGFQEEVPSGEADSSEMDSGELEADGEPEGSRTLFSFLEPGLDVIGSFGAPIVIAGIFALIVGIVLAAFVPALRLYGFIVIGVGVVLLAAMALIYLSSVLAAFISRTGRYGVNSLIMLAAFLGIVVVLNFITFSNNARIDTTANQQFSLANSTRNLLRDLEEPVRAVAFFREDIPYLNEEQLIRRVKVEDTLSEFSNRSSMFSYELVDPDILPEIARNLGVTVLESIAIQGEESRVIDIVQPTDQFYSELEQDLYTSILVGYGSGTAEGLFPVRARREKPERERRGRIRLHQARPGTGQLPASDPAMERGRRGRIRAGRCRPPSYCGSQRGACLKPT